jgi:hypothetical protein
VHAQQAAQERDEPRPLQPESLREDLLQPGGKRRRVWRRAAAAAAAAAG